MAKLIRYIGNKRQKQIFWLEEHPVWNEGNDFLVELTDQQAAFIIRRCPNIFKVAGVVERQIIPDPTPVGAVMGNLPPAAAVNVVETEKVIEANRLFGTKAGEPYKTFRAAQMQINRTAETVEVDPAGLEIVEFADGFWIKKKETETEQMPVMPDDMEMTETEEVDPV